jgi:DNA-binding winged helix-turn-helix (wHTH) protein
MGAFLASIQRVVNHDTLLRAGWPDEPRTPADLATRLKTLRRKIRELDMSIVTLPGRGYLIDVR